MHYLDLAQKYRPVLYFFNNKKLSCRSETARRFVSLNILQKSFKVTQDHSKWHCCVGGVW